MSDMMDDIFQEVSNIRTKVWTLRDNYGIDHLYNDNKGGFYVRSFGTLYCTGEQALYTKFREHHRKVSDFGILDEDYIMYNYYDPNSEENQELPIGEVPENLCELCHRWELMRELAQ